MDRRVKERLVGATILVVLIIIIVPELLSGPKERAPPPAADRTVALRNVTVDLATSKATPAEDLAAPPPQPGDEAVGATATTASGAAAAGAASTGATSSGVAASEATPAGAAPAEAAPAGRAAPDSAPASTAAAAVAAAAGAAASQPAPKIATLKAQQAAPPAVDKETSGPKSKADAAGESAASGQSRHRWYVQFGSFASRANADKLLHRVRAHDAAASVSAIGKGASLRYRVRSAPLVDRDAAERALAKFKNDGLSASLVPP